MYKKLCFVILVVAVSIGCAVVSRAAELPEFKHVIVFAKEGTFAGWPANNGIWIWGNEILAGLVTGEYREKGGHNKDSDDVAILARSTDGGETWSSFDPDNYTEDGGRVNPPPGGINFAHPGFAMKVAKEPESFWFSYDRGSNWQGPYNFGNLMNHSELDDLEFTSRTDYIVNGPDDCFIFMSAEPGSSGSDVTFTARTTDGGATFNFVSWIVPKSDDARGVMPSTVRCSATKLVTVVRRRSGDCWVDCYVSNDNGSSWTFQSKVGDTGDWNGNPPAMVRLRDGRLCCVYGNRDVARIYARYSEDEGQTWLEEFTIRDDFKRDSEDDPDLGYPRIVQRPDGKLVAVYYWATEQNFHQHIAATIWSPGGNNGDINRDGVVNFLDLAGVAAQK